MRDVVICEPVRTAVGGFGGSYKDVPAHVLGATVVEGLMARTKLPKDEVDDVIFAQCYPRWMRRRWGGLSALDAGLRGGDRRHADRPALRLGPAGDHQRDHAGGDRRE